MRSFYGKTALITGASSGIGEQFARQLAAAGCHLILVARRHERLQALAQVLNTVTVDVVPVDLQEADAAEQIKDAVQALGRQVDVLVNNAGFGYQQPLVALDLREHRAMVEVNVSSLLSLTRLFAEDMTERGEGWILQVASVASYVPVPGMATYSASKAFVLNLGQALHHELKAQGVVVTTLCPGGTRTEFSRIARKQLDPGVQWAMMEPGPVAKKGLHALAARRAVVVPGRLYQALLLSLRFLPQAWVVRLSGAVMGRHR